MSEFLLVCQKLRWFPPLYVKMRHVSPRMNQIHLLYCAEEIRTMKLFLQNFLGRVGLVVAEKLATRVQNISLQRLRLLKFL